MRSLRLLNVWILGLSVVVQSWLSAIAIDDSQILCEIHGVFWTFAVGCHCHGASFGRILLGDAKLQIFRLRLCLRTCAKSELAGNELARAKAARVLHPSLSFLIVILLTDIINIIINIIIIIIHYHSTL